MNGQVKRIDPRIHLGIDNCFAIKRWTAPMEWGSVIRELGMKYVEAVPDLECEPMLMPDDYRRDWVAEANRMQESLDVKIVMFYSNDSTYDSIGFSHPDFRVRDYFVNEWFEKFTDMAAGVGADIGYYVQATPEKLLYYPEGREKAAINALNCMVDVNRMAKRKGITHVAQEQMYTPHQPPFTIEGMRRLIKRITVESGYPFYFTEDVGHHCPMYLRPNHERVNKACARYCHDDYIDVWLGSREAQKIFKSCARKGYLTEREFKDLEEDFVRNANLFNAPEDTDCYAWLRELGAWSPVIHLQQTDGTHSSHEAFLPENNAKGKICPIKLLQALSDCYNTAGQADMPPMCEDIYLIQELYLSTKDIGYQGLHKIKVSTDYLRKYIPEDGLRLSELLERNEI